MKEILKKRIAKKLLEIEQIFLDAEHWNRTHPDEEPINPDPHDELKFLYWRFGGDLERLKK